MTKDKTRATSNTASSGPVDADTNNMKKPTRISMRGKYHKQLRGKDDLQEESNEPTAKEK